MDSIFAPVLTKLPLPSPTALLLTLPFLLTTVLLLLYAITKTKQKENRVNDIGFQQQQNNKTFKLHAKQR